MLSPRYHQFLSVSLTTYVFMKNRLKIFLNKRAISSKNINYSIMQIDCAKFDSETFLSPQNFC